MKIEITNPSEIHLIFLAKYQKSSANIVARVEIDYCATQTELEVAANKLVEKHVYLNARYYVDEESSQYKYYYEEISEKQYDVEIHNKTNPELSQLMTSLSPMRTYLFSLEQGELFKIVVYQGIDRCIVELTIAHIVGEAPSALILMGDYLHYLDQGLSKEIDKTVKEKKYFFYAEDFGWSNSELQRINVSDPGEGASSFDPWSMPAAQLARHELPADTFLQLRNWLNSNNISAKVSDLFYFVVSELLKEFLNKSPEFWLIMSYRNLAQRQRLARAIYNFAFFAPVASDQFDNSNIKAWLEGFYQYRSHLITQEGVSMSRSFRYNLNRAMEGTSLQVGKRIMNSVTKFPDFAFNNYGKIDQYIGSHNNINVTDIEIQDGTPVQEIRYFSFKNKLYMNSTFFVCNRIDAGLFWDNFFKQIFELIDGKNIRGFETINS